MSYEYCRYHQTGQTMVRPYIDFYAADLFHNSCHLHFNQNRFSLIYNRRRWLLTVDGEMEKKATDSISPLYIEYVLSERTMAEAWNRYIQFF